MASSPTFDAAPTAPGNARSAILRRLAACPAVELLAPDEVIETTRTSDKVDVALKSGRRLIALTLGDRERVLPANTFRWHVKTEETPPRLSSTR